MFLVCIHRRTQSVSIWNSSHSWCSRWCSWHLPAHLRLCSRRCKTFTWQTGNARYQEYNRQSNFDSKRFVIIYRTTASARTGSLPVISSFTKTYFRTTHCRPWSQWIATPVSNKSRSLFGVTCNYSAWIAVRNKVKSKRPDYICVHDEELLTPVRCVGVRCWRPRWMDVAFSEVLDGNYFFFVSILTLHWETPTTTLPVLNCLCWFCGTPAKLESRLRANAVVLTAIVLQHDWAFSHFGLF